MPKITKTIVDRLALGSIAWDETVRGFGIRRQRRDAFYVLRYRISGKQRLVSIGRHGSPWTPETARKEAQRLLGLVVGGVDPNGGANDDGGTVAVVLAQYLERKRSALKPLSFDGMRRHLMAQCKPLHSLKLGEVNRRGIAVLLADVEQSCGPVARNRVRTSLVGFFQWCIREGLLELNPASGTGVADEGHSRDRVLSEDELRSIWKALGDDEFSDICRLLILTAQRRTEVGGLRWSEIDLDRGLISIPPERSKNNRLHQLPMSSQVRAILERRPRRDGCVFGTPEGGFSSWSEAKAKLDQRLVGVGEFRLHDLRRSAATWMGDRLDIQPHIIEAVLNHLSGFRAGVSGIYQRAKYQGQMRDALQRYADWVDGVTG